MENHIVAVDRISHRYAVQWAVKDISFEISHPGVTGLLGSNGAGKSTVMNIICGVLTPTSGSVSVCGVDMAAHPVEAKKNIGFLPQRPPLYGDLTVDEYLSYAASLRGLSGREVPSAVAEAEDRCGLTHFRRRLIRNLSGGYQQRVGIAQAIVHNPKFVVMDEPTNGLDPNQVLEVRKLVNDIAADRSVLVSTHILSEVQASCSRIIMIEHGGVVFDGSIDDFDNYIEPDTFIVSMSHAPSDEEMVSVEGVSKAEQISEGGDSFRLWFDGDRQTMARFVDESVEKGWGLYEISLEHSSMNDIFARLSQGRNAR